MKCAGQDEVIVNAEFIESGVKVTLINKSPGFINDQKSINDPARCQLRIDLHRMYSTNMIRGNSSGSGN